jgi:hypothetical protein
MWIEESYSNQPPKASTAQRNQIYLGVALHQGAKYYR